jgi:hypothetical protein
MNPYTDLQPKSPTQYADPKSDIILKEKIALLQKEFAEIDVNHDQNITKDELLIYLDRKSGKQFDRAIANEIYEQMDKNHDGTVTINEFIKVYIEADEILNKKIETAKSNKEYYKKQQEECLRKAEEAKQSEKMNMYGVMEGSFVDASVIEAKGLRSPSLGGPAEVYIEVTLEDGQLTKTKSARNNQDPRWEEKMSFDVAKSSSQLRFVVLDGQKYNKRDFEGEVIVLLEELKDQNIHDVWLDLFDKNGQKTRGQLHVKLQWIHSKVIYHTLYAQKWFEYYKKEDEELQEYERYLQSLHDPFTGMKTVKYAGVTQSTTNTGTRLEPPGFMDIDTHVIGLATKMAAFVDANPNENFWSRTGLFASFIGMVLGVFICFSRGDFIDVMIPFIAFFYLVNNAFRDIINLKTLAWALFISTLVLDLPWLWIYTRNWAGYDVTDSGIQGSLKIFCIFICYINIVFKVIEGLVFYMIHIQSGRQVRGSVPRVVVNKA